MKREMALVIWLQKRNETQGVAIDQRFPTFLPWRNPKNHFPYPEESLPIKTLTGQKELRAGRQTQLLLNCHENLFLKNARGFVCGRQNVGV
jgi:hypothetical protein